METLFKAYVYKNMISDLSKFARKTLQNVDFDRERLLRRVGLSRYTPVKTTMGGFSLFVIGAVVGAAAGLALAPKTGAQLRADVKDKALDVLDSMAGMKAAGPEERARA
jgi:hypothetical protein